MEIVYTKQAQDDVRHWITTGNIAIQNKITQLLNAIELEPYKGIGKPEALKHKLTGKWSRKINREHRIVYEFKHPDVIIIHSLKGHYE